MTERTTRREAPGTYDRRGSSRPAHPPARPSGGAPGGPPAAEGATPDRGPGVPPGRARRRRGIARAAGGALVAGLGTLALLVHTDAGRERVRRLAERAANDALAGRLHVGRVGFGPGVLAGCLTGTCAVRVDSLALHAADGAVLLTVRAATARVALLPLLRGRLVVAALALDGPALTLRQRADGRWDWETLLRPSSARPTAPRGRETLRLAGLTVRGGAAVLELPWAPDAALSAAARDGAARAAVRRGDVEIRRLADGRLVRRRRLVALDVALPELRVRDDGTVAVTVAALALRASDPALAVRARGGTLRSPATRCAWTCRRSPSPASARRRARRPPRARCTAR
jgi:hypothetical protein